MCFLCPACRFIPDDPFDEYICDGMLPPEFEGQIEKAIRALEEQYGQAGTEKKN